MKRYLWVVEVKYPKDDWEVYEVPEINVRAFCRQIIAREKGWQGAENHKSSWELSFEKYRIVKYVPQEKAK